MLWGIYNESSFGEATLTRKLSSKNFFDGNMKNVFESRKPRFAFINAIARKGEKKIHKLLINSNGTKTAKASESTSS
mgnify:CR=1 FL=1